RRAPERREARRGAARGAAQAARAQRALGLLQADRVRADDGGVDPAGASLIGVSNSLPSDILRTWSASALGASASEARPRIGVVNSPDRTRRCAVLASRNARSRPTSRTYAAISKPSTGLVPTRHATG